MPDVQSMQLRDYVSVVRRRKWLIVLSALVVVGSALAVSSIEDPVYEGSARLLLQRESAFDARGAVEPTLVETEIQIIQSEPVREAVRARLGSAPAVTALGVGGTTVIEVRAQSTNPSRAALITNTYVESYIGFRRQQAIDSLAALGQEVQLKVDALQKDIDELAGRIGAIPACTGTNPPPSCSERESLQKDRDAKVAQLVPFRQRLDQLQVDLSLKSGGAQIVTRAATPTEPIRPRPVRNGLIGLGVGLMFGVALAFVFEHLDDSIKTKDDFERVTRDVPVLGIIPLVGSFKKGEAYTVAKADPNSAAAEAYRTLRTSIQFVGVNRALRTLQITSPSASEGKSTTAANLAVTLARAGRRVIVASCDLRRPRVHDFFGMSNSTGFTSVLLGEAPLNAAIKPVPGEERLQMLAAGPLPPNPSELLSSRRTGEVFGILREHADIVIVDCPPVLPVTDAAVLSSRVDATLLVITMGSTTRKQLSRALEILHQVDAPIIGAVLNGASTETAYGYADYYYRYERSVNGNGNGSKKRPKSVSKRSARPKAKD